MLRIDGHYPNLPNGCELTSMPMQWLCSWTRDTLIQKCARQRQECVVWTNLKHRRDTITSQAIEGFAVTAVPERDGCQTRSALAVAGWYSISYPLIAVPILSTWWGNMFGLDHPVLK